MRMMMTMMTTPRGWQPALTESCRCHRKLVPRRRMRRLPKGLKAGSMRVARRRHHLAICMLIHSPLLLRARPSYTRVPLNLPVLAIESRLRGWDY